MAVSNDVEERVRKALRFECPDRPPIWEMIESAAVYERFAPGVPYPECAAATCEALGIDATYGCYPPAGQRVRGANNVLAGDTVWSTKPVFADLDALRSFRPSRLSEREMEERLLQEHEAQRRLYEPRTMFLPQNGGWGFLPGYDARTFEVISLAIIDDIGALARYWDHRMELGIVKNQIIARYQLAPVVQCCEDVAYKTALMVSPGVLRDHFFPRFKQVIAPLKQAGIKVIWHSDGNILPVLDDAVDCGIDGIDPLERTAGMDIKAIREKYGRKLILVGNVDSQVLTFGNEEQVRMAVRECMRSAGAGGGHFIQSDAGQIMPDVPVANVIAYIDEVRSSDAKGSSR
ncbi:MAG: hypothetical protein GXY33_06325 [Phycisphaerae bacterium]|nr:hypothetical protein [Phycisphaerae bacterium]